MGKLLGPAARDRRTWRNCPPQSPWSRAWGGKGNYHHGGRPLPPAPGYAAFGFRRPLLSYRRDRISYRRDRTAATRSGGAGSERALSNSVAGGGTAVEKHFLRDAVPSRVYIVGLS